MKTQGIILGLVATLFLSIVAIHLVLVGQYGIAVIFGFMLALAITATKQEYKEYKQERYGK